MDGSFGWSLLFGAASACFIAACGGGNKAPEAPPGLGDHATATAPVAAASAAPAAPTDTELRAESIDDVRQMREVLDDPAAFLMQLQSDTPGAAIVRDKLRGGVIPPAVADAYLVPDKRTGEFKAAGDAWAIAVQRNQTDVDKALSASAGEVALADNLASLKKPDVSFAKGTVYFATDRSVDDKGEPQYERGAMRFGECDVLIPPDRAHPQSSVWNQVVPWSGPAEAKYSWYATRWRDNALDEAADIETRAAVDAKDALVFIHGFNNTLEEACARAARIRSDMDYHGPIFMFSWPAHGGALGAGFYDSDLTNASSIVWQDFVEFLSLIKSKVKPPKIHLIAHSMGVEVTMLALQSTKAADAKIQLNELVLAASDVDADGFLRARSDLLARAERVSVYSSQWDRALSLSKDLIHRHQRLGALPPPRNGDWFDLIDASVVDTNLLPPAFGHGYIFEKTALSDVRAVLAGKKPSDPERDVWLDPRKPGPRSYAFTVK